MVAQLTVDHPTPQPPSPPNSPSPTRPLTAGTLPPQSDSNSAVPTTESNTTESSAPAASNSVTPTKATPINSGVNAKPESQSGSSMHGLSTGAKIGIGVGIPILLILIGGALFLFFRRRRRTRENGDVGEGMIGGGKVHLDEDQSSGPSPVDLARSGTPPQAPDGHMYAPPAIQDGYGQGGAAVPVMAPVARRSAVDDEDFMHRPVSPVHDDDLMTEVATVHTAGRSATALGGSIRERGSPTLDHVDGEMEWILEEERKARERREQQGRLPHSPSSS